MYKILALTLLFIFSFKIANSQSKKDIAHEKGIHAIKLEDEGKYDEALGLLQEAQKLDPENSIYPYEMGYTYFLKKDLKKALKIFKKVVKYKNINDQCFQMLGSIYDYLGDTTNAFKSYDEGLKMFPNSGKLFLEKGNVYWIKKLYTKALPFYEKGIYYDPKFPSNYYRASILYCSSNEPLNGLIYGEIFINLEKNSKRTEEISQLLYNTYKKIIKYKNDSSFSIDICKIVIYEKEIINKNEIKLPFCMIYGNNLVISCIGEKHTDLNSICRIKSRFIQNYYNSENYKKYPNALFDYENTILTKGHLDAYNYWILRKGDEEASLKWQKENEEKWERFIKWFKENPININENNKFYSDQY